MCRPTPTRPPATSSTGRRPARQEPRRHGWAAKGGRAPPAPLWAAVAALIDASPFCTDYASVDIAPKGALPERRHRACWSRASTTLPTVPTTPSRSTTSPSGNNFYTPSSDTVNTHSSTRRPRVSTWRAGSVRPRLPIPAISPRARRAHLRHNGHEADHDQDRPVVTGPGAEQPLEQGDHLRVRLPADHRSRRFEGRLEVGHRLVREQLPVPRDPAGDQGRAQTTSAWWSKN